MMKKILVDTQTAEFAQGQLMTAIPLHSSGKFYTKCFSVQQNILVTTPSAGAFTAADTDICTKTGHNFKTGLKVRVSNAGGALPSGLAAGTDYFVVVINTNTFKLADSLAHANAGTVIDITDAGTGTHTITPTALAGGTVTLQGTNDGGTWVDVISAVNITGATNRLVEKVDPAFDQMRYFFDLTAGQLSVTQTTILIGEG